MIYYLKKILLLLILVASLYPNQQFSLKGFNIENSCNEVSINNLKGIIGVMVEFELEEPDDLRTSGDGKFITINPDEDEFYPSFINYDDLSRCSKTLLDPPPHNVPYFESQLKAVINYYRNISDNQIFPDIASYQMAEQVYLANESMEYYARSENKLTELYVETVIKSADAIVDISEQRGWDDDEFIVVVFHAGLGQDLGSPGFDPTIYDIHSAYIDSNMLSECSSLSDNSVCSSIQGSSLTIQNNAGESRLISEGILLPETLNPIYYDVVEDMYNNSLVEENELEDIYCYYQTGMTGLFAYLLGYRLCMPPMHGTDNIYPITRIGRFGLMDYGAYNRHGLIPSPPNPWTRIKHQQISPNQVINKTEDMFSNFPDTVNFKINPGLETVYRIDITDNEYFLIEHRSNLIRNNSILDGLGDIKYSLDAIIHTLSCNPDYSNCDENKQNDLKLKFPDLSDVTKGYDKYWLDIMKEIYGSQGEFMENGVIINFPDYDHGLPGSGILIWHIKEPSLSIYNGLNNNRYDKTITLEEGDGMSHLGFYDPNPFGSVIPEGWEYDFWYSNNAYYQDINRLSESEVSDNTFLNEFSIPNSNTSGGIKSNISIQILSDRDEEDMELSVRFTSDRISPIVNIDENVEQFRYLGNMGSNFIFYELYNIDNEQSFYYVKNLTSGNSELWDVDDFSDICSKDSPIDGDDRILYYVDDAENSLVCLIDDNSYYFDENIFDTISPIINPKGYFNRDDLINNQSIEPHSISGNINYAFGDFDNDGLDEIVTVSNGYLDLIKNNGIAMSGFPINKEFIGHPLIADVYGSDTPEIICKTNNSILVISYSGNIIEQLPLYDISHEIALIPDIDYNYTYLINGNRLYKFDGYNPESAFWMNPYSTTYNYPEPGVDINSRNILQQNWQVDTAQNNYGIDMSKAFNYPNPFEDQTVFRFFTGISNSASFKIYNAAGFLVDDFNIVGLQNHQYNEYPYNASKLEPGLYLAEIKSDKNETKLIKLLKTK